MDNKQHDTNNRNETNPTQETATNTQPTTLNDNHAANNTRPTTSNARQATTNKTNIEYHTPIGTQHTSHNEQ